MARVASSRMSDAPPRRVRERLRDLPSVDRLATSVARAELAARRDELLAGASDEVDLVSRARGRLRPSLRRVLNATGVVVHTNLGRAPLAHAAARGGHRRGRAATRTSSSTWPPASAARATPTSTRCCARSRARRPRWPSTTARPRSCSRGGAGGPGRDVVVSRGQLIEIGGGFRVPEVVAQAGRAPRRGRHDQPHAAERLPAALGERTGAILRVHPSNFRTLGFTEEVEIASCPLRARGSGHRRRRLGAARRRAASCCRASPRCAARCGPARRSSASAATSCSAARRPGSWSGPARRSQRCRRHPLARAVRIDTLSLAALEATLALYRDPDLARAELPVLRMLDGHVGRARRARRRGWPRAAAARSSPRRRRSAAARCR